MRCIMPTLDASFSALADPTRRAILARLALGEATVGELAEPFEVSLSAISKHLKVLETAYMIVREKRAQQRVCRLRPEALKTASDWIKQNRRMWEERFDRLDAYLRELQSKENNDGNG